MLCRDVTDDEAFVDELRVTLRFFAAVLVRRTQKARKRLRARVKKKKKNLVQSRFLFLKQFSFVSGGRGVSHYAEAPQSLHEAH